MLERPKDLPITPRTRKHDKTLAKIAGPVSSQAYSKMRELLQQGELSMSEIAKAIGVHVLTVKKLLENDVDLAAEYNAQWDERIARVEDSMISMALGNGRNEIAQEKAQEFILRYNKPKKYSEAVARQSAAPSEKRINISLNLPTIAVDANGIPIPKVQSANPLQEVIDVKADNGS